MTTSTLGSGRGHAPGTCMRMWLTYRAGMSPAGELHNNLRMKWGKAFLPWLATPDEAIAACSHVNHKYALDGCDPCSYGGILWCVRGKEILFLAVSHGRLAPRAGMHVPATSSPTCSVSQSARLSPAGDAVASMHPCHARRLSGGGPGLPVERSLLCAQVLRPVRPAQVRREHAHLGRAAPYAHVQPEQPAQLGRVPRAGGGALQQQQRRGRRGDGVAGRCAAEHTAVLQAAREEAAHGLTGHGCRDFSFACRVGAPAFVTLLWLVASCCAAHANMFELLHAVMQ